MTDRAVIDTVVGQLKLGEQFLHRHLTEQVRIELNTRCMGAEGCESPAEAIFAVWWEIAGVAVGSSGGGRFARLRHQVEVDVTDRRYRLDFQVVLDEPIAAAAAVRFEMPLKLGVEIDGHDFHERTKEQVQSRDRRDRDLQMEGWQIFHYSGAELFADPIRCVTEVRLAVVNHYELVMAQALRLISS